MRSRIIRRIMAWAVLLAILLSQSTAGRAAEPEPIRLSKRDVQLLTGQLIPAYHRSQPLVVLEVLSSMVARMDSEQVAAVDTLLTSHNVPLVAQLLTEIRLNLVRQGLQKKLPKPNTAELILILGAIQEELEGVLQLRSSHPVMAVPAPEPADLEEYEQLFWKLHVFTNQVIDAEQLSSYAQQLARVGSRQLQKSGTNEAAALAQTDFGNLRDEVAQLRRRLFEREIEFRLNRLHYAQRALTISVNIKERLLAARALDVDSALLMDLFPVEDDKADGGAARRRGDPKEGKSQRTFESERLNAEGLAESIRATHERGKMAAGDLLEKSRLLFDGMHWWLRGRYGRGPDWGGLMKSEFAIHSPQAQLPLFMPAEFPVPTDPVQAQSEYTPEVDRRHHYIWTTDPPRFRTTTAYFF